MFLPDFYVVNYFPPDHMHGALLGVTEMYFCEWFNSSSNTKDWYLGKSIKDINTQLLSFKPTKQIDRVPQLVEERKFDKASEWRNWLLYYSMICLSGILKLEYLKHWFLFVFGMHIFLKDKIEEEEFILAKDALRNCVSYIENMYAPRFMTFNVRTLMHIPHYVKMYGALWGWLTFPYENYNGILKNPIRSS